MRKRKHTRIIFSRGHILLFLLCVSTLVLSLFVTAKGRLGNVFLGFAAPSATRESTSLPQSPVQVKLVPQITDVQTSAISGSISLTSVPGDKPSILIYHTHTLEAYTPSEKYPYTERGGSWRTNDNTRNIVTVGEKLANELRDYGFNVLHDTTNHEPPKLSTSYERSLKTMESYKKKYPSLVMFIDLHRDASGSAGASDYCVIDGEKTARVMFVVGTGKGATGTGFDEMPDFDSNYSYASAVTEYLESVNPQLVREIRVKTGRYNQHISSCCMLIEIGHNMNTLEEALAATKHVAAGIAQLTQTN